MFNIDTRDLEENIFKILMIISTVVVLGFLALILFTILLKGLPALNFDMIFKTSTAGYYIGKQGGILNAILGSLVLGLGATFLAFLLSICVVFYLNVYLKKNSKRALFVRFIMDILLGVPSIVYGALGFTIMIFFGLRSSLLAGIITVSLLIFPIMARGMDEVLKTIPFELKEASYALGSTRLETAMNIIFKQALPGILTAVLIAFGRGIGDAASVLFTTGYTDSLPTSLFAPVATLPLAIFFQLGTPFKEVQDRGYASAFILTLMILLISIAARSLTKKFIISQGRP